MEDPEDKMMTEWGRDNVRLYAELNRHEALQPNMCFQCLFSELVLASTAESEFQHDIVR